MFIINNVKLTQVGDIISRLIQFTEDYEKRTHRILEMYYVLKAEQRTTASQSIHSVLKDVEKAIQEADLTEIQAECLLMYYFDGLNLTEIAGIQRVNNHTTISRHIKSAIKKVADVMRKWKYWD